MNFIIAQLTDLFYSIPKRTNLNAVYNLCHKLSPTDNLFHTHPLTQ